MYDATFSEVAGGLTRELRTQIQEMMTVSHALASGLAGNERMEQYLTVLNRAICSQLRLVRQVELDQRLNSPDEIRLSRAPVDLVILGRDVMETADALTRPLLGIRAGFSASQAALVTMADGYVLREMLLYLLSEAVGAVGQGGDIRLKLDSRNGQAIFVLTDSGGGPAPVQVPPAEAEDPESAPRGLLLARRIAALHGGTLITGSTEAGGVRAAVSIPIVERERAGGILHSAGVRWEAGGGWDPVLVGLSGCLPAEAFRPDRGRS